MRRPIAAVLTAMLLITLFPATTMAAETAACNELYKNRWQGHQSATTAQRHGAQAIFEAQALQQCINPGLIEVSGSFVFSNIVPTDGGANDIIQIGAGNCRAPNCPAGQRYYSAYGRTSSTPGCSSKSNRSPLVGDEGAWANAAHVYKVVHQSNEWSFFVDNTKVGWVLEGEICWTPRSAVWFGESWDFGDQIGGTAANKFSITQASYTTVEGGGWTATSFNAAAGCNYVGTQFPFNCDVTGLRSINIWTDR